VSNLVLSLFPGIGLLDMAFEEQGFCVVRGPDVLWGGDVRRFHPPTGRFDGVIGGPPCPHWSRIGDLVRHNGHEPAADLIPEYVRCVEEAAPHWFVMENVPGAPRPCIAGYAVHSFTIDNHWIGGEQGRVRRFSFGVMDASAIDLRPYIEYQALAPQRRAYTVLAGHGSVAGQGDRGLPGYSIAEMCELQGLPAHHLDKAPFTVHGKKYVIGNGVPLPMGRAIAKAVKEAISARGEVQP
jgi:DNA (cytosine-5)-methyltransferase 1